MRLREKREGKDILQTFFATLHIIFPSIFSECVPLPTSTLGKEVKRDEKEFGDVDNIPE